MYTENTLCQIRQEEIRLQGWKAEIRTTLYIQETQLQTCGWTYVLQMWKDIHKGTWQSVQG